jgi:hypothetical protein
MTTRRRHTPEQVVRKLQSADQMLAEGKELAAGCQELRHSALGYQTLAAYVAARTNTNEPTHISLDRYRVPPVALCLWPLFPRYFGLCPKQARSVRRRPSRYQGL